MTTLAANLMEIASPRREGNKCEHCDSRQAKTMGRWLVVVLYALAMAWVESAVVFYIRAMIHRLEPYQPNPLPIAGGLGFAETVREAATLIMLITVGWLAGRTWRSRIGYTLLAFGVWDIAYYIWLIPLTGWPHALSDWDILFLIPLPWWGPIWSPMSIALLMILFGSVVARYDSETAPLWPRRNSSGCLFVGVGIALWVFMTDSLNVLMTGGGTQQLRDLLPTWFNWPWFSIALGLMAAPVVDVLLQVARRNRVAQPPFDFERWLNHFERNRENRAEPNWQATCHLPPNSIPPLLKTLTQFQLGDGGGPCSLIAFDAGRFRFSSVQSKKLVDAWFREEAEHSRLLGCAVERLGGRPITNHWSFTAFCAVRRWGGVRFELQVLLLTEIVSTTYYRVLHRHVNDAPVRDMATLILRDEGGHVAFHCDRLAHAIPSPNRILSALWQTQFWLCGFAAASVLWINHGPCLRPFGTSTPEFYREVIREIGGFIRRLAQRREELASRHEKSDRVTVPAVEVSA